MGRAVLRLTAWDLSYLPDPADRADLPTSAALRDRPQRAGQLPCSYGFT